MFKWLINLISESDEKKLAKIQPLVKKINGFEEAMKLLLAGADVVHLASVLLRYGPERLSQILADMNNWMNEREYDSVSQLKGSMSQKNLPDPSSVERASYLRVLGGYTPTPGDV